MSNDKDLKTKDWGAVLVGCFGILTGGALVLVLISLLSIFINAWTLSTLWGWIVVPIFHVQPLLYWQAYGITVLASWLTKPSQSLKAWKAESEIKTTTAEALVYSVVTLTAPIMGVFIVWVVLHYLFVVL